MLHSGSDIFIQSDGFRLEVPRPSIGPSTLRDFFVQSVGLRNAGVLDDPTVTLLDMGPLQIRVGERWAFLGRNGAGKSTLCRVLAGLLGPTEGSVERTGSVRAILDPSALIYPDLSGFENARLLFDLLFSGYSDFEERLEEALSFTELGEHLSKPVRTYSTGMLVRLNLSLLTGYPADLLILDEVFEGADRFWSKRMSIRMMDLIDKSGALVFVSHNQDLIRRLCSKALILQDGKVAFAGNVEEGLKVYGTDSITKA